MRFEEQFSFENSRKICTWWHNSSLVFPALFIASVAFFLKLFLIFPTDKFDVQFLDR